MITLEMYDGEIKEFNFPEDKEQKLVEIIKQHKNKKIHLKTEDDEYDINLSDIDNCYIGKKPIPNYEGNKNGFDSDILQQFKDLFGMK